MLHSRGLRGPLLLALLALVACGGGRSTKAGASGAASSNRSPNTSCSPHLARLAELDEPLRAPVKLRAVNGAPRCRGRGDWSTDHPGRLFADLPQGHTLHPSYEATERLCGALLKNTASDAAIDGYLSDVSRLPALKHALSASGGEVADLKRVWFDRGGFRHAICGEPSPRRRDPKNIGGYHFWYRFYEDERGSGLGAVDHRCTLEGAGDPTLATIRFEWSLEGKRLRKPIGGFTVGESVAALLALGYVAVENGCDRERRGADLVADVNGRPHRWVVVSEAGALISLYPLADDKR